MSDAENISWAVVELMGHRRVAGYVTEREVAGQPMLQIDIPRPDGAQATQIYSGAAVYAITPTTEEIATAVALNNQPTPVHRWELPAAKPDADVDLVNDADEPLLAHEVPDGDEAFDRR